MDAQERLNLLRTDLRDTQLQAERHREDARVMTKLQEEERLRAIRAQQRAEEAEREKRDRELQAEYLRREAENARLERSRLLEEKIGQEDELEALREHCDVVSGQNREVILVLSFSLDVSLTDSQSRMNLSETIWIESTESPTSGARMTRSSAVRFARWKSLVLALDPPPSVLRPVATEQFYLRIKIM